MEINKKSEIRNFHLMVKNYVDKILIFQINKNNTSKYVDEMIFINNQDMEPDIKIFNGTVNIIDSNKFSIVMLADEATTSYTFNNLFSIPIDNELLSNLKNNNVKDNKYIIKNTIILNVPDMVKFIIIKTPEKLRKLIGLSKYIFPVNIKEHNITLFPEKTSNREKLSKGVDPQANQYIVYVYIDFTNIIQDELDNELIESLDNHTFEILCYSQTLLKTMEF